MIMHRAMTEGGSTREHRIVMIAGGYFILRAVYIVAVQENYSSSFGDELLALLLLPAFASAILKNFASMKGIIGAFALYSACGLISALLVQNTGVPQPLAALYDIALDSKVMIIYGAFFYLFSRVKEPKGVLEAVFLIVVVLALLNLPFVLLDLVRGEPIGIRGQALAPRMGVFQPQGLMLQQVESAWLSMMGFFCSLFLFFSSRRIRYLIFSYMLGMLTILHLSTKESIAVALSLFIVLMPTPKRFAGFILTLPLAISLGAGILLFTPIGGLVAMQIDNYVTGGLIDEQTRSMLTLRSWQIASDYFPLGTGAGTYASPPSFTLGYSDVYVRYELFALWGASEDNPAFLTDVFWPKVLGQAGFLGFIVYMIFLWGICKGMFSSYVRGTTKEDKIIFCIGFSVVLVSIAASPFTQEFLYVLFAFVAAYAASQWSGDFSLRR